MSIYAHAFGMLPEPPRHLSVRPISVTHGSEYRLEKLSMELDFGSEAISFPFTAAIPEKDGVYPVVITVDSERDIENHIVLSFSAEEAWKTLSKHIAPSRRRNNSAGKIALWTWVVIRLAEYAEHVYKAKISVEGRGIYALVAKYAAEDGRVAYVKAENEPIINRKFIEENQLLFSPSFARCGKNVSF